MQNPIVLAAPVVVWLLVLSGVDLLERRLPNALTIPGVLAAVALTPSQPGLALAIGVAAVPYVVAVATGGCGAGDLKLAVVAGALAGEPVRAAAVVVIAALLGVAAAVVRCRAGPAGIAHGPAIAVALLVVVI